MSNVSIFEKNWIDLVFEGKNQKYGAYQLRQESPRTTAIAFIFGLLFLFLFSGIIFVLSSFGETPVVKTDDNRTITVCNLPIVKPNFPKKIDVQAVKKNTDNLKSKYLINPEIVKTELAVDEIKTNEETKKNPTTNDEGETGGTAISGISSSNGSASKSSGLSVDNGKINEVVLAAVLDKQPTFAEGMDNFYKYISKNFEHPELDEPMTIRVLVSFVIEKDGSMTNITVLENPGFGMDKEAIRVLKSLKTKWIPGYKNGVAMRTLFTLPIAVRTE